MPWTWLMPDWNHERRRRMLSCCCLCGSRWRGMREVDPRCQPWGDVHRRRRKRRGVVSREHPSRRNILAPRRLGILCRALGAKVSTSLLSMERLQKIDRSRLTAFNDCADEIMVVFWRWRWGSWYVRRGRWERVTRCEKEKGERVYRVRNQPHSARQQTTTQPAGAGHAGQSVENFSFVKFEFPLPFVYDRNAS